VAELIQRGIRLGLHELGYDLPPLGLDPRGMAPALWLRGLTPGPAKTRDQRSNNTRTDGKTLGELTD
jgi:hypothetical protein